MLEPNLYRVRVNACPAWTDYQTCTLGISVGQPYHEGEKFAATVEWAARHFEQIRVDVSDTLQRHRLMGEGTQPGEAEAISRSEGDAWIASATPILANCGRSYTIIRWDTWLRYPDFFAVLDAYAGLVQSDAVLRTAIAADIESFITRHANRGAPFPAETWMRAASRAYLIEELAVITLQGAAARSARIYPGPELESFKVVRAGKVPDAPPGLDRDYYVHVNLEHRRAPAQRPQARTAAAAPKLKIA
jgi:tRNA-dependent cyclodipeptide synthase